MQRYRDMALNLLRETGFSLRFHTRFQCLCKITGFSPGFNPGVSPGNAPKTSEILTDWKTTETDTDTDTQIQRYGTEFIQGDRFQSPVSYPVSVSL